LQPPLQIGLAGLGAVGREVARRLATGIPGLRLAAVAVREPEKAHGALAGFGQDVKILSAQALAER